MKKLLVFITALMICPFVFAEKEGEKLQNQKLTQTQEQIKEQERVEKQEMKQLEVQEQKQTKKQLQTKKQEEKQARKQLRKLEQELKKQNVRKQERTVAMNSFKELNREGFTPEESRSIVSKAVMEAHGEGLYGTELAERIHQVIRQRKQDRDMIKEMKKSGTAEQKQIKAEIKERARTGRPEDKGGLAQEGTVSSPGGQDEGGSDTGKGDDGSDTGQGDVGSETGGGKGRGGKK